MDAKRLLVFNVTQDEVDALWVAQGGKCAVCQRPIKLDSPATCLDHDHDIGVLRGLLCFLCNRALGLLQDDVERVKAARAYLTAPPAYRVLGQRYACIGRAKVRTVPRSRRAYFFPYGTVPSAPALRTPTVYRCGCCDFSRQVLKVCCLHRQPKTVEQGTTQVGDTNTCPV